MDSDAEEDELSPRLASSLSLWGVDTSEARSWLLECGAARSCDVVGTWSEDSFQAAVAHLGVGPLGATGVYRACAGAPAAPRGAAPRGAADIAQPQAAQAGASQRQRPTVQEGGAPQDVAGDAQPQEAPSRGPAGFRQQEIPSPGSAGSRVSRFPPHVGYEIKWLVWNEIWYNVNTNLAAILEADECKKRLHLVEAGAKQRAASLKMSKALGQLSEVTCALAEKSTEEAAQRELRSAEQGARKQQEARHLRALEDEERRDKHLEAARASGALPEAALRQVMRQAAVAGEAVAAGYVRGDWLPAATCRALDVPEGMQEELWSMLLKVLRTAAVAIFMAAREETDRAEGFQSDFEEAWHELVG